MYPRPEARRAAHVGQRGEHEEEQRGRRRQRGEERDESPRASGGCRPARAPLLDHAPQQRDAEHQPHGPRRRPTSRRQTVGGGLPPGCEQAEPREHAVAPDAARAGAIVTAAGSMVVSLLGEDVRQRQPTAKAQTSEPGTTPRATAAPGASDQSTGRGEGGDARRSESKVVRNGTVSINSLPA